MRLAWIVVVGAVIAAVATSAWAGGPQDERAIAAEGARGEFLAAINQEEFAREHPDDPKQGATPYAMAYDSVRELTNVAATAKKFLGEDPAWMGKNSDGLWEQILTLADAALGHDRLAMEHFKARKGSLDGLYELGEAITYKKRGMKIADELAKPACAILTDVRGPITVNGVPQGEPQATFSFSCTEAIRTIKIWTPGEQLDQCTAAGGSCAIANGSDVTEQAGGTKQPSVTVQGNALADGEQAVIDIVPIAGDSYSYVVDEVM